MRLSRRALRTLSTLLTLATAAGVAFALHEAVSSSDEIPWPSAVALAVASVVITVRIALSTLSWITLLAVQRGRAILARGFLYGQLGKYVPGGVIQMARLYQYSRRAGVEGRVVAAALPVHALCATIAPGAAAAIALAFVGHHLHPLAQFALGLLGAIALVVSIDRRLVSRVLDALHKRWRRVPSGDAVPSQRAILRTFAVSVASSGCLGASYAILLGAKDAYTFVVTALCFIVAFTVGFMALPFPSGIGVREAVLTALLISVAPVADTLSAAIAVRTVQLLLELVLTGAATVGRRRPELRDLAVDDSGSQS